MEGFTYTNIFETKGIEYLVIISFFAVLIPVWLIMNRKTKQQVKNGKLAGFITADSIRIPQGLFFSKYHTWAYLGSNGEAKVGLDDFLLRFTGEVTINHIKKPGEKIKKGDVLTLINKNGKNLRILSPISGEIQKANSSVFENHTALSTDPYKLGWMYSIKPSNWKTETNSYYLAEDATNWAKQELERFKDFLSVSLTKYMPQPVQVVLQDGGEIVDHALAELPEEIWDEFQDKFLN
jgi:glycine cleavage system H protein